MRLPRHLPCMQCFLRLATAGLMLLAFALTGSLPAAGMTGHDGMGDCPQAMMMGGMSHGTMPDHPASAVPMPSCCYSLPPVSGAIEATLQLPRLATRTQPRPLSDRALSGSEPGPELPPPRV